MMKNAIEVSSLTVARSGREVLHGLDLTIPPGQVTGLLGPSGCGKSTLMRAVVGVQRTRSGEVRVIGEPAGSRVLRDRVAYQTQAASVYDDLTVAENLRFFARVLGVDRGEVDRAVEAVDLGDHRDQVVGNLSGGQRSRANLAVAVLVSSHVMDEAERCDRLLLMRDGRIIADGTPQEIREKAGVEDIEQAFLAIVREDAA